MEKKMPGGNCRYSEGARMGQTIRTETGPDRSSHMMPKDESLMAHSYGSGMGGGPEDVSHSLTSAGKVNSVPDPKGGRRSGPKSGTVYDNNKKGGSY